MIIVLGKRQTPKRGRKPKPKRKPRPSRVPKAKKRPKIGKRKAKHLAIRVYTPEQKKVARALMRRVNEFLKTRFAPKKTSPPAAPKESTQISPRCNSWSATERKAQQGIRVQVSKVTTNAQRNETPKNLPNDLKYYAFTNYDLQLLYGVSESRLKELIRIGEIDPTNLETICFYWYQRTSDPNFKRSWPISVMEQAAKRIKRSKAKKYRTYVTPKGLTKTVALPDVLPDPDE